MSLYSHYLDILKYLDRGSLINLSVSSKFGYDLVSLGKKKYNSKAYSSKRCNVFDIDISIQEIKNISQLFDNELIHDNGDIDIEFFVFNHEGLKEIFKYLQNEKYIGELVKKGIKKGDIIRIPALHKYDNYGLYVYDGKYIKKLCENPWGGDMIHPNLTLEEFNSLYWNDILLHVNFVWLNLYPYKKELLNNLIVANNNELEQFNDIDYSHNDIIYKSLCKKWQIYFNNHKSYKIDVEEYIENIKDEIIPIEITLSKNDVLFINLT